MKPGLTKDEELLVEQVERLGPRRLAEIVVNHCHRDERLYQTVRIVLAASTRAARSRRRWRPRSTPFVHLGSFMDFARATS